MDFSQIRKSKLNFNLKSQGKQVNGRLLGDRHHTDEFGLVIGAILRMLRAATNAEGQCRLPPPNV